MAEGDPTLPDNVTQFRRKKVIALPPGLEEIKEGPTTWLAMTVEEQMTELAGIIAKKTGISITDVNTLAYSKGIEALFKYCFEQDLAVRRRNSPEEVPDEGSPERKPSA